jgi:Membrane carboxypeptidase (penicillin-binding protein)
VTDPQTGEVLALIGGRETRYEGFNRALDALRPIGSLVKPAVYLAALEQGYTLATPLQDEPFELKQPDGSSWQPQNFDRRSHGVVPLHRSLALSYNQSTARLGMDVGLARVIDMLQRLGAERELKPYPSLLLGAQALSPLELASIYQTIAANWLQGAVACDQAGDRCRGHGVVTLSLYPETTGEAGRDASDAICAARGRTRRNGAKPVQYPARQPECGRQDRYLQ